MLFKKRAAKPSSELSPAPKPAEHHRAGYSKKEEIREKKTNGTSLFQALFSRKKKREKSYDRKPKRSKTKKEGAKKANQAGKKTKQTLHLPSFLTKRSFSFSPLFQKKKVSGIAAAPKKKPEKAHSKTRKTSKQGTPSTPQSPTEKQAAKGKKFEMAGLFRLPIFQKKKKDENKKLPAPVFRKKRKKKRKRAHIQHRRHQLTSYLDQAGITIEQAALTKKIFNICIVANLVLSGILIYFFASSGLYTLGSLSLTFALQWIFIFSIFVFLTWVGFYLYIDLRIFKRKTQLEDVLPDYLMLTASNIKAGMTIDRALWYAVRPRFGVLAREIEFVAKEVMSGVDLKIALKRFGNKYDSVLLKRSISLLIEGIDAGGEIGDLLNKIALNIQENKIMRREMSASVATYVIFISFATIAAAPALFALAGVLIKVIGSIGETLGGVDTTSTGFALSFSGSAVQFGDFRIFAIVSLIITSIFSGFIIATIKKGSAKFGFKYIPVFIASTLILYLLADLMLGKMVGLFF